MGGLIFFSEIIVLTGGTSEFTSILAIEADKKDEIFQI